MPNFKNSISAALTLPPKPLIISRTTVQISSSSISEDVNLSPNSTSKNSKEKTSLSNSVTKAADSISFLKRNQKFQTSPIISSKPDLPSLSTGFINLSKKNSNKQVSLLLSLMYLFRNFLNLIASVQ